ncbi:MarR family transcriptional regulator [Phytomonospora endophytica]|uniref:DNA-binding MarR family transcriptional regulator n=1 Tax=Phytomonospora endophytica TaxID=714109 RepID=A0A841FKA7_9ACTN|nr:MarR family transcriptional regulator [Phytomonospora endophytica]MBB6036596.1 DNA-binding MarR family transcriptional regulator [Phytomonospora endophytica]GIG65917.1 transcriptional regulator [Phytomonospora endophytica]
MSSPAAAEGDLDESIRTMLLLMPRLVARAKRISVPESLRDFAPAPRHRTLLALLLFDGKMTVSDLATRLEVAPSTVSLMVGDLSRKGLLDRREDDADRRRMIVSVAPRYEEAVVSWLAPGARAWNRALEPLTDEQRRLFVDTMRAYEEATLVERGE